MIIRSPGYAGYKQAQTFFALTMGLTAWAFMVGTEFGLSSMSPETYGSAAIEVPAQVWALWQALGAMTLAAGLAINGRNRRLSAPLRFLGSAALAAEFIALSLSAALYGGQFLVAVFGLVFAVNALFFAAVSSIDVKVAWRHG